MNFSSFSSFLVHITLTCVSGDLCAAKFVDGDWYRAKVEKVNMKEGTASVLYVDYGNRADIPKGQTASLPGAFTAIPHFAHEYSLALCQVLLN